MDARHSRKTSIALALLAWIFAGPVSANDDLWGRVSEARVAMMQAAINGKPNAGKPFEGICPIRAAEVSKLHCLVHNDSGTTVGEAVVFLDDMKPEKGVSLLNNCADGTSSDGKLKKFCIVFFDGITDTEGNIFARDYEIIKGAEDIPSLN